MNLKHFAIFIDNASDKNYLFDLIFSKKSSEHFLGLQNKKGALFSKKTIVNLIEDESRHDRKEWIDTYGQTLKSMSSGEQKKSLLNYILISNPDFIVLDNPFDNLDRETQIILEKKLFDISKNTMLIQVISRKRDLLPFIKKYILFENQKLTRLKQIDIENWSKPTFEGQIPLPLSKIDFKNSILIALRNISVSYGNKPVLQHINWIIKKGEFWELRGRNGSGKTTLLSMITGENPKGYGQELFLFGQKKGSGESIWDIKKKIGYFTPSMTDTFKGYHSIEHMLISGLTDSVGLYTTPTEAQLRLAKEWLQLLQMWGLKDKLFNTITVGQKRLIMCVRAMIKNPPLLILDEPTVGLDDESAALFVALVNKFAQESNSTVIFVSHRDEPNLEPEFIYKLQITDSGSIGSTLN